HLQQRLLDHLEAPAQRLGVGDRGEGDGAARIEREARNLRQLLEIDRLELPLLIGESRARRGGDGLRAVQAALDRLALEVVPEARELRELALELRHLGRGFLAQAVRRGHLPLGGLAARELLAVAVREMELALAL